MQKPMPVSEQWLALIDDIVPIGQWRDSTRRSLWPQRWLAQTGRSIPYGL